MQSRLSIIIPSFRDARIIHAIHSIRQFDDASVTKIIVVDGGSEAELVETIRCALTPNDVLIAEPDKGIFDGLNKGLALADTEFVGWLGSDDVFTGAIKSSDVVMALTDADLFVADVMMFRERRIRRRTRSWPSGHGLAFFGLHNPHYSTFGRRALLQSERFDLTLKGADIDYFLRIFKRNPTVATTGRICTLQREGGFSTKSYARIASINLELWAVYRRHGNPITATVAVAAKLLTKVASASRYRIWPTSIERHLSESIADRLSE
jgi:glycosyltransferase